MITIKMQAGLGNQLFQYALYYSLKKQGREVCVDDSWFLRDLPCHQRCAITAFGVEYNRMADKAYPKYIRDESRILNAIIKKYGLTKRLYVEKESSLFDPHIFDIDNVYLDGYWQSIKYFSKYADEIRDRLTYKSDLNEYNRTMKEMMQSSSSVSIHVRRGDYLTEGFRTKYGDICTADYYLEAMRRISDEVSNPKYFVFSDDIDWCKQNINGDVVFVCNNTGINSYLDMVLMTYCKHHIIANSSFSWWGTFLSKENGVTISPSKWQNTASTPDIWCDNWIRI